MCVCVCCYASASTSAGIPLDRRHPITDKVSSGDRRKSKIHAVSKRGVSFLFLRDANHITLDA